MPAALLDRVLHEGRLADARLAAEQEAAAGSGSRVFQEPADRRALELAPQEHAGNLPHRPAREARGRPITSGVPRKRSRAAGWHDRSRRVEAAHIRPPVPRPCLAVIGAANGRRALGAEQRPRDEPARGGPHGRYELAPGGEARLRADVSLEDDGSARTGRSRSPPATSSASGRSRRRGSLRPAPPPHPREHHHRGDRRHGAVPGSARPDRLEHPRQRHRRGHRQPPRRHLRRGDPLREETPCIHAFDPAWRSGRSSRSSSSRSLRRAAPRWPPATAREGAGTRTMHFLLREDQQVIDRAPAGPSNGDTCVGPAASTAPPASRYFRPVVDNACETRES